MHKHLEEILKTGQFIEENGSIHQLHSHISIEEGLFLQDAIKSIKPNISLEVGMAFGISTMFICETLIEVGASKHIVIDPYQIRDWQRFGLYNLKKCGYIDIVDFKNEFSEIALPKLLEQGIKIDFAFIDGFHTFDHTLLDFFYINRMLNVGGIVVFDDSNWDSINKVINYISNYPSYQPFLPTSQFREAHIHQGSNISARINRHLKNPQIFPSTIYRYCTKKLKSAFRNFFHKTILHIEKNQKISISYFALQKISDDVRSWEWYKNF